MKSLLLTHLLLATLIAGHAARAAEKSGVSMPDSVVVSGKTLKLNGLGLRTATIFAVQVHVSGLYLEAPSHDPQQIASDVTALKRIEMKFVRDVSAKDVLKAWKENFELNCDRDCESAKPGLQKLLALLSQDIKNQDTFIFDFTPAGVLISINGQDKGLIEGAAMNRIMMLSWIGPKVACAGLREGMLGLSKNK